MRIEVRGLPLNMEDIEKLAEELEVNLKRTASRIFKISEEEIFCNCTFNPFIEKIEKLAIYIKGHNIITKVFCATIANIFLTKLEGNISRNKIKITFEGSSEDKF